jgi:RNA polymerase sigma-70 factor (ECF subfamily)
MPVDDEWCRRIHERLLAGDPTATAELAETVGDVVFRRLQMKHAVRDPDVVRDAAWEAIRGYMEHPAAFDPSQRGLLGYLDMAAEGDLRNALAKARRRRRREELVDPVELAAIGGNKGQEQLEARMEVERIRPQLDRLFPDRADREAVDLIVEGERSTEAFVEVWGLGKLSLDEQRKAVKRGKDRLKMALQRLGQLHERKR